MYLYSHAIDFMSSDGSFDGVSSTADRPSQIHLFIKSFGDSVEVCKLFICNVAS